MNQDKLQEIGDLVEITNEDSVIDAQKDAASDIDINESDKEESDLDGSELDGSDLDESEVDGSDLDDDLLELNIEGDSQEGGGSGKGKSKKLKGGAAGNDDDEAEESLSDSESDEDDDYLQKFNQSMRDDLILNFHPESRSHNYEEIKQLAKVSRNKNGIIVDELHKTIPILTKYEKTRVLGQRAKQIESGAVSLVQVPPNVIDSYLIAKLELAQNKIPFIIRRPLPNGGMEYWYVSDLENL